MDNAVTLRWLILDLNSFFASCEQQERPELRGQPIIVVPMLAETTCAIAASYPAKAFGIKTGTPVHEARALCPGLRVVPATPKLYVGYHHRIKAAIESCIPVEQTLSVDEVACRLDKTQQTPEAAAALSARIKAAIRQQVGACLTSSIGIAPNQLLAKLASDMQKPDGLTILTPESLPQAIAHLPATALSGIGRQMGARLATHGIHTIGALWQQDSTMLRRLWGGIVGQRFHLLLHGADLPSAPERPRRSISHQHVLPPAERSMAAATPVLRQLLVRAAERLRREDYYCRSLSLDVKWTHHHGYAQVTERCPETQDTALLLRILMRLWAAVPPGKPLRIGVVLGDLVPASAHQGDLFATPPRHAANRPPPPALSRLVDTINSRYGHGTLHFGSQRADLKKMTSKIAFHRVPDAREF